MLSCALLLGFSHATAAQSALSPEAIQGIVALSPRGKPVPRGLLTHPLVHGIVVAQHWQDVERANGSYNWSYFDQQIPRVAAAGKFITLQVTSGGQHTPSWAMGARVQTFSYVDQNQFHSTYQQEVTIPVFWDATFLSYKTRLIAALGARFAANPHIKIVSATCVNAATEDWNLPSESADDVDQWLALGYTSDKLIAACRTILDATMHAFPNQYVRLAVGRVRSRTLDRDPDRVAREVVAYADTYYPGRLIVQKASLSAITPDPAVTAKLHEWQLLYEHAPLVAGQMLWSASDIDSCRMNGKRRPCDPATVLRKAVTIGANYGMLYQEIYGADLMNPSLNKVLREAANLLTLP